MRKLNILINAYAVSPTWGSEPGVGWNWITNIAKECNVFVITESEWESDIKAAIELLPQKDNIHFYFNPVSLDVRKMCWNQGDWRFYGYYREWQKRTYEIALNIIKRYDIDIIHQLNMIGFREPGYLWRIKNIPYIWGPIGNMAPTSLDLLNGSPLKDKLKLGLKNIISYYQARTGRVSKAIRRADRLITALDSSADIIKNRYGIDNVLVVPETGLNASEETIHTLDNIRKIKLLWVGRFIPTKKLDLAFEILSMLEVPAHFEFHIVGWGNKNEENRYHSIADNHKIATQCIWHGKIPNAEVQALMRECDIFLFTSILEGTPHVVLEAISNNLPVLCFDTCGQGVIVNDKVGWKVPVKSLKSATVQMADILNRLDKNREIISNKSRNCQIRKPELSWEYKIRQIVDLYRETAGQ